MKKTEVRQKGKRVDTGAYSAGILADGWLYVSGQGPLNLEDGSVIRGTIGEETLLTLSHIRDIVREAGGELADIVKCTVHLKDIDDFDAFNSAYRSFFDGCLLPARTTVQSVLADGIKIEIDAVAFIGAHRDKSAGNGK